MESVQQLIPIQTASQKKESLLIKRLKAKQKTSTSPVIKLQSKFDVRKERNRYAAQKSRDKKKQYLQKLQQQNMKLNDIISRCEICSAAYELHSNTTQDMTIEKEEELIPITQSPPTFINQPERFIRQDDYNEDSSSHFSKYFWFGCLVVIICMTNFHLEGTADQPRQLIQTSEYFRSFSTVKNYTNINNISMDGILPRNLTTNKTFVTSLMNTQQISNCQKCMQCLRNITRNNTHGELSLLGSKINETLNKNSTNTSKILFCKSKAKFFHKIYQALMNQNQKQQKNSRQITKMLVKGKALNQLMQQDCFFGQEVNETQEYIISFSLAILEMTPVKVSRSSKLSMHSD